MNAMRTIACTSKGGFVSSVYAVDCGRAFEYKRFLLISRRCMNFSSRLHLTIESACIDPGVAFQYKKGLLRYSASGDDISDRCTTPSCKLLNHLAGISAVSTIRTRDERNQPIARLA